MKETKLKKEFKQRDVQRARNLINKDFTGKTQIGSGYSKKREKYQEGDIWEEDGRTWTIQDGLKQTVNKLDSAKKYLRKPLCCPKCEGTMKHRLSDKMWKIHRTMCRIKKLVSHCMLTGDCVNVELTVSSIRRSKKSGVVTNTFNSKIELTSEELKLIQDND